MNSSRPALIAKQSASAFTLIELLIVVLIIAILAAIAVPNFLEFQTRAKVARVKSDHRNLATGIEAYRVDQDEYPEGTDNPANFDQRIVNFLGPLAPGFYTMRTQGAGGLIAGIDFFNLTTPVAYIARFPTDPFALDGSTFLTYCYRNAKDSGNGWILTSFGPDNDIFSSEGGGPGKGTNNDNPLGTKAETSVPARLGDISERQYIHFIEGTGSVPLSALEPYGGLNGALLDLSYDPTNGTVSDGDVYRVGP